MLKEQLKNQIATEAEANTKDFSDNNDYQAGYIQGYKDGYEVGGECYGEKAQKAEEKADRYEKALKEIVNTASMDGYVLKKIANNALTPKTSEDELHTKP